METKQRVSSSGISFGGMLAIVFIALKLTNNIDWSWLWILSPLWIPIAIVLALAVGAGLVFLLTFFVDNVVNKRA